VKKGLIVAVLLTLIIGLPVAKKQLAGGNVPKVEIDVVKARELRASILASGQIKNDIEVKLTAEVIGKVSRILVKEGEVVKKGQLLLTIDDRSFKAAVEQQQASVQLATVAIEKQQLVLENAKAQWQRKKALYEQGLIDQDQYEQVLNNYQLAKVELKRAKEQLTQAKAQLAQAQDQLARTQVRAPIDGTITSLDIKVGETAISSTTNIAGSSLLTIADPDSILAEVNVDEADIAKVKLGQKAKVVAVAFEDQPLDGKVIFIASSAKRAAGQQNLSFAVRIALTTEQMLSLRPGMSCRAEIITSELNDKPTVPQQAVRTEEDNDNNTHRSYVFVYKDGMVRQREITTDISDDQFIAVKSGIDIGEQIVVGPDSALRTLKDEDVVQIEDERNKENES